jgi:hypothetical protein
MGNLLHVAPQKNHSVKYFIKNYKASKERRRNSMTKNERQLKGRRLKAISKNRTDAR